MKIIGVGKIPAEALGQQRPDGGFAGASDAHDQNDHRTLARLVGTCRQEGIGKGKDLAGRPGLEPG
jgi:hypothetical protein